VRGYTGASVIRLKSCLLYTHPALGGYPEWIGVFRRWLSKVLSFRLYIGYSVVLLLDFRSAVFSVYIYRTFLIVVEIGLRGKDLKKPVKDEASKS